MRLCCILLLGMTFSCRFECAPSEKLKPEPKPPVVQEAEPEVEPEDYDHPFQKEDKDIDGIRHEWRGGRYQPKNSPLGGDIGDDRWFDGVLHEWRGPYGYVPIGTPEED